MCDDDWCGMIYIYMHICIVYVCMEKGLCVCMRVLMYRMYNEHHVQHTNKLCVLATHLCTILYT